MGFFKSNKDKNKDKDTKKDKKKDKDKKKKSENQQDEDDNQVKRLMEKMNSNNDNLNIDDNLTNDNDGTEIVTIGQVEDEYSDIFARLGMQNTVIYDNGDDNGDGGDFDDPEKRNDSDSEKNKKKKINNGLFYDPNDVSSDDDDDDDEYSEMNLKKKNDDKKNKNKNKNVVAVVDRTTKEITLVKQEDYDGPPEENVDLNKALVVHSGNKGMIDKVKPQFLKTQREKESDNLAKLERVRIEKLLQQDFDPRAEMRALDPYKEARIKCVEEKERKYYHLPIAPLNLFVQSNDREAYLWWEDEQNVGKDDPYDKEKDPIIGYVICRYRRNFMEDGRWDYKGSTEVNDGDAREYRLTNIPNGFEYYFTIAARCNRGLGLQSQPSNITLIDIAVPDGWKQFWDKKNRKYFYRNARWNQYEKLPPKNLVEFDNPSLYLRFTLQEHTHLYNLWKKVSNDFKQVVGIEDLPIVIPLCTDPIGSRQLNKMLTELDIPLMCKDITFEQFLIIFSYIKTKVEDRYAILERGFIRCIKFCCRSPKCCKSMKKPKLKNLDKTFYNTMKCHGDWGHWKKFKHSKYHQYFYYNTLTNLAVWDTPKDVQYHLSLETNRLYAQIIKSDDERNQIQILFFLFDIDEDGFISKSDLIRVLETLYPGEGDEKDKANNMIKEARDAKKLGKCGVLTYENFVKVLLHLRKPTLKLIPAFNKKNSDKKSTKNIWTSVFTVMQKTPGTTFNKLKIDLIEEREQAIMRKKPRYYCFCNYYPHGSACLCGCRAELRAYIRPEGF